jgi:hypothetical protein
VIHTRNIPATRGLCRENDEFPSPNDEGMSKAEGSNAGQRGELHSSLVLRHSFAIRASSLVIFPVLALLLGMPLNASACATCYGASDSPLAQGMNWGILTLLGFIGFVLSVIVVFFVHIGRRSARLQAAEHSQSQIEHSS